MSEQVSGGHGGSIAYLGLVDVDVQRRRVGVWLCPVGEGGLGGLEHLARRLGSFSEGGLGLEGRAAAEDDISRLEGRELAWRDWRGGDLLETTGREREKKERGREVIRRQKRE